MFENGALAPHLGTAAKAASKITAWPTIRRKRRLTKVFVLMARSRCPNAPARPSRFTQRCRIEPWIQWKVNAR